MKRYNNYHKHDHVSSIYTPDTNTHAEEYIKKSIEYGHTNYFTTNHGSMGDIFEAKTLCDKYGIRCLAGLEGYIVPNPLEKDRSNYHIIIIPRTDKARKKVNRISSMANIKGYYYKPRIFIEDLLKLNKDDVYITTACVAGLLKDDTSINEIFMPLVNHFGKNIYLEVQNHNEKSQIEINKKCLMLHEKLGLELIAANDSHYVDLSGKRERAELLKGKHINYGDEDDYVLDFPTYDVMLDRFIKQGVLSKEQAEKAIDNTLIFDECEEIKLDKEIKMPTIYPDLTPDKRYELLEKIIYERFNDIAKNENIKGSELEKYLDGIKYEMKIVKETNDVIHTADYFLFNEKNVSLATEKYGGVLTRTGRGSCGSFYINRILGMTQLDRFKINLPLYPDRFASTARLLENRALPDIDYNVVDQKPFVDASRELLGYDGCYPMIAYGTMQRGEAFRNVCRSHDIPYDDFNHVAKNIEEYENDNKWKPLIEEANKYVGTIISASVHPCAHILSDKNLIDEYGVVRVGEFLCVMITSSEADEYKVLKNDYLVVKVWKLISETFDMIGQPIIDFPNLLESIKNDERVWDLFKNGITCTLNQVDSDNGMQQAKKYGIKSYEDGAFLAAAIRPSFDSWRNTFLTRTPYSTGSKDLDTVLEQTNHFILFQENLMQYFDWLGVSPAESIGLIKKISKKKIKQSDFDNLAIRLKEKWIENTGSDEMFDDTWKLVQSCIAYGFASPHAAAVSGDMCYGAYLKVNHPLEYYCVCLNNYSDDMERTKKLINELKYFNIGLRNIKFGFSKADYSFDKNSRIMYKGISSIKYMNGNIANELYDISQSNNYESFTDLLFDIKQRTSVNSRQLDILIKLDFFSDFGDINTLLRTVELYDMLTSKKQIKKDNMYGIDERLIRKYSGQETETSVKELDYDKFMEENFVTEEQMGDCIKYKYEKNIIMTEELEQLYREAELYQNDDEYMMQIKNEIEEIAECEKVKTPNGYSFAKVCKKFDLTDEQIMHYASKITYGKFSDINYKGLIKEIMANEQIESCNLKQLISYQREFLGYIDIIDESYDWRYVVITKLDTKYAPRFEAYCINNGKTQEMKIPKKKNFKDKSVKVSFSELPLEDGDVIYIKDIKKKPRQRKDGDKWVVVPGEYNWWINDYKIVNK